MQTMISRAIVIGAAALSLALPVVATEPASAGQGRGGFGGWRVGGWHSVRPQAGRVWGGGWRGGAWRAGGQAWAWGAGGSIGAARGWRGQAWAWGAGRSVGAASGWNAGRWMAGTWYGGWWGPAPTVVVVSNEASPNAPDASCWEVLPVYSYSGNYIGRQIINTCD